MSALGPETRKALVIVKKMVALLLLLFVLMAALCVFLFVVIRDAQDEIDALRSVNVALADHLFFDRIDNKEIDIFVSPGNRFQTLYHSGYRIRIMPLYHEGSPESSGSTSFMALSNNRVYTYACFIWESDRDLAMFLIRLLSPVVPGASHLLKQIQPDRSLNAAGKEDLEFWRQQYMWRRKKAETA